MNTFSHLIKSALATSYWVVNKKIATYLGGLEAACLLTDLIDKWTYHQYDWFYFTIDDMKKNSLMSRAKQETHIKTLINVGFIEMKVAGSPPKRNFNIIAEEIFRILASDDNFQFAENQQINLLKTDKSICRKSANSIYMNINNRSINNRDNNINIDFEKLLAYFNKITGKNTRVISQKTKDQIRARLKEGFTKEDIASAIKNCYEDKYHIEENHKHLTLEFITRSAKLERYSQKVQIKTNIVA